MNTMTMNQIPLFTMRKGRTYPVVPGFKRSVTSHEAARAVSGRAQVLRERCLDVLKREALTADEVADRLGEDWWSIRPRISELAADGLVAETGERRKNASGHSAMVWRAAR